jgi:hypothetical protein
MLQRGEVGVGVGQGSSIDDPGKDVVTAVEVVNPASTGCGIWKPEGCRDDEQGKSNGIRLSNQTFVELLVGKRHGARWVPKSVEAE